MKGMRQPQLSICCGGEDAGQNGAGGGGDNGGETLTGELPAGEKAPPLLVLFGQKRRGAAEAAAGGNALNEAGKNDRDRCERTDHRESRRDGDDRRAKHHQGDRQHEGRLAAAAIGESAEQDRAKRPDEEGDAECRQGDEERFQIVLRRKEQLGDGRGEIAVDDEIEPFERIAERGGGDRAPALGAGNGIRRGAACRRPERSQQPDMVWWLTEF